MKNFLITGGAGMIGSNLAQRLLTTGNVFIVDNLWRGKREDVSFIEDNRFYQRDLLIPGQLDDILKENKIDVVIHLADIVAGIGFVMKNQGMVYHNNTLINTNVFHSIRNSTVKQLINIGTACSFPKHIQNSISSQLKESELYPADPESAYGWSKLMSCYEAELLSKETDIIVTNLLFHNVYGSPCDFGERSQVLPSLIYKVIRGDTSLEVWGTGNQGRAFLHVDDAVESIVLAIEKRVSDTIQIGPDTCTTIREAAEMILMISGKKVPILYDTTKPEGDMGRCADYSKAKMILNWSPKVSMVEGLTRLYSWIFLRNKVK
jgi:nucleoside-diphosphate-sugar epimerase